MVDAKVYGFIGGTRGLCKSDAKEISEEEVASYINSGGMQLLGRTADVVSAPAPLFAFPQDA
ncbi:MAG: hypothetical protein SGPRY_003885 [Prymnesium sp.]